MRGVLMGVFSTQTEGEPWGNYGGVMRKKWQV